MFWYLLTIGLENTCDIESYFTFVPLIKVNLEALWYLLLRWILSIWCLSVYKRSSELLHCSKING